MYRLSRRSQEKALKPVPMLVEGFNKYKNNPYDPETNPQGIINLGTSENKLCDDLIIPKLKELSTFTTPEIQYFPIRGIPEFRGELASFIQEKLKCDVEITSDNITVTNGCNSACSALAYCVGDPGDYFMYPVPFYGMLFEYMNIYSGIQKIEVETTSLSIAAFTSQYEKAISANKTVKGIAFINPSNPTGQTYTKQQVMEVLKFAKEHELHVIMDEIYCFSIFGEDGFTSCLSYSKDWPDPQRTHFIWGFSKDFCMSGMRCGMIYSQNSFVHDIIQEQCGYFHMVAGTVQMTLCRMLQDKKWVNYYLSENHRRLKCHLKIVTDSLDKHNITYLEPKGTLYLWADFSGLFKNTPSEAESNEIFYKIIDQLIYIPTATGAFHGKDSKYFRIVYAVKEQHLIEAMKRFDNFVSRYIQRPVA